MSTTLWMLASVLASASAWVTPSRPKVLLTSAGGILAASALAMVADMLPDFLYGAFVTIPVVISFIVLWGTLAAIFFYPVLAACLASDEQRQSALGRMFGILGCDLLGLWLYVRWILSHPDPARRGKLVQLTLLPFSFLYSFDLSAPVLFEQITSGLAWTLLLLACLRPPVEWLIRRCWLDGSPAGQNSTICNECNDASF